MATKLEPIDISSMPDLVSLAEEVQKPQQARHLQRDGEILAELTPVKPARKKRSKGRPLTEDDALFRLIGIGNSGVPGGISGKKHEALLEGYRKTHSRLTLSQTRSALS